MMERKPNEASNSEENENMKSEDYERFENAARRIMRQSPDEAEKIRKKEVPKDPEEKESS